MRHTGRSDDRECVVSIVVTHYRSPDKLRTCLGSLENHLAGIPHELIVCDSASDGSAETVLRGFPPCRYIAFEENVGYAVLVNAGLLQSRGEFILVLNADVTVDSETLPELLSAMRSDSRIGIAAPALLNPDGSLQQSAFADYRLLTPLARRTSLGKSRWGRRELTRFQMGGHHATSGVAPAYPDWVMGAALLVRRDAMAEVGPLDTQFWMYFEDVDWCRRFRKAGWRVVWWPFANAMHEWGRASRDEGWIRGLRNRMAWIHLRSGWKYLRKHGLAR